MRNLLLILVLAAAGYYGYKYWQTHYSSAPGPAQEAEATPAPTATPVPLAATVLSPAHHPHLAPLGYLYVLQRVSKTTDSGVTGVDPGTPLLIINRGPEQTLLTDGTTQFQVDNSNLTNDTDVAELARSGDPQSQAALATWMRQRHPLPAQ